MSKDSTQDTRVNTLLVFTYYQEKATRTADTYAVGVQREEPGVLKGLLMLISR